MPIASYKSYNLACPIFVLYLGKEGVCPKLLLEIPYQSYNLGLLSYNYFQIHVQPAYRQVYAKCFAAMRQIYIVSYLIFVGALVFDFVAPQRTFVRSLETQTKIFQRKNKAIRVQFKDEKTLLALENLWKILTKHHKLMYLTGGRAPN